VSAFFLPVLCEPYLYDIHKIIYKNFQYSIIFVNFRFIFTKKFINVNYITILIALSNHK